MRNTALVTKVLECFKAAKKPLSVPELQTLLAQVGCAPNKTTLYRMLEKLVAQEQIETLLLDPKVTYYEIKAGHHHHHFRCDSCDTIACIDDPALESQIHHLEAKLEAQGLSISNHHFSFSGKCQAC